MPRKTKVRIVGDSDLVKLLTKYILNGFETEKAPIIFERAVGRDYSHTQAPGMTVYLTIKGATKQ